MKVKELIAELQKLDQEKGIWISYDGSNGDDHAFTNGMYDPIPDDRVKKPLAEYCKEYYCEEVKEGDYLITVG